MAAAGHGSGSIKTHARGKAAELGSGRRKKQGPAWAQRQDK